MDADSRIRTLLVDDHALVRAGLRLLIDSDPACVVVAEAGDRSQALAAAAAANADVILLDIDLSGDRATDFLPELLACSGRARVLMLTGLRDQELHRDSVRLGARGVLLKDQAAGSLLKAIRKVHEGELWLDRSLTADLITALTAEGDGAKAADPEQAKIATLTAREREVIGLVADGHKNRDIASRLFISDTTVRHHLTAVFAKLDVPDRLTLALYAFRHGLATLKK
jgi:two-component system nitrate/nitrite response regulator NarL